MSIVVFDIDGVLAQNHERVDLIECDNPDWDTFFQRCAEDTVQPLVKVARLYSQLDYDIVLLSSRPESTRKITEYWLNLANVYVPYDILLMRQQEYQWSKNYPVSQWKCDELNRLCYTPNAIELVFEDDPKTIWAMRDAGWPVIPIYSGYYDCPKRRVKRGM